MKTIDLTSTICYTKASTFWRQGSRAVGDRSARLEYPRLTRGKEASMLDTPTQERHNGEEGDRHGLLPQQGERILLINPPFTIQDYIGPGGSSL